jgi:hypothetical protein
MIRQINTICVIGIKGVRSSFREAVVARIPDL